MAVPVLPPPLSTVTRFAYGLGSVAYGIKGNGFSYFLLLGYSQAFGLEPGLVSTALLLALLADAFSDPVMGYLSDHTTSRFGRRHVYMYGAAVPIAVAYVLLWNPPEGLSQGALFAWLLVFAITVRLLLTIYEVPCTAMAAELSRDYDERTRILTLRTVLGYVGGVIMAALTLLVILDPEATGSSFNDAAGFREYGVWAALAIFASIMACALGTRHRVKYMSKATARAAAPVGEVFGRVFSIFGNPSLRALFAATLFGYVASGVSTALTYYLHGYFWELSGAQSSIITASVLVSALIAFLVAVPVSKRFGKKWTALGFGAVAFSTAPLPVILRLLGLLPENGDPVIFWIVLSFAVVDLALIIAMQAIFNSMVADLVEVQEVRTGKRSEAQTFAAITLSRKSVEGFGLFFAGIILSLAGLAAGAAPEAVSPDAVFRLGLYYAPTVLILWALMLWLMSFYRLDRAGHEANLAELARRAELDT